MKAALYRRARLDAWLDTHLDVGRAMRQTVLGRAYLRLLPEREIRTTPFTARAGGAAASVLVLALVPPEDTGGGSRPAQLAAELHRRGCAIDWRYALPIFPWPQRRRPELAALSVHYLGEDDADGDAAQPSPALVLVEAPHPRLCAELDRLPQATPVVYDAIDVWDGPLGAGWYDEAAESALLHRASALVASSGLLCAELARRTGRDVTLIPNGVDRKRFDPSVAWPVPADLHRGEPTVVYVGSLWGEWVDLDLVAAAARALPRATFNLIGPRGTRRVPAAPNIAMLGAKPQAQLPAYLQAADVTIVPFVSGRLTAAVSPLKAFEYLAMERPVVTTPLPELDGAPGVTTAGDLASFVAAIQSAASAPFPRDAAAAFSARHTWQDRVERLLQTAGVGDRIAARRKD